MSNDRVEAGSPVSQSAVLQHPVRNTVLGWGLLQQWQASEHSFKRDKAASKQTN